jgi:hypothetical protein
MKSIPWRAAGCCVVLTVMSLTGCGHTRRGYNRRDVINDNVVIGRFQYGTPVKGSARLTLPDGRIYTGVFPGTPTGIVIATGPEGASIECEYAVDPTNSPNGTGTCLHENGARYILRF